MDFLHPIKRKHAARETNLLCLLNILENLHDISQDEQKDNKYRENDDFDSNPPIFLGEEKARCDHWRKKSAIRSLSWTTFWVLLIFDKVHARFLTVTKKFQYNFIYNSRIIYPGKTIWKLNLLMLNIFLAHVDLSSAMNSLSGNCTRGTFRYIPKNRLLPKRLFETYNIKIKMSV